MPLSCSARLIVNALVPLSLVPNASYVLLDARDSTQSAGMRVGVVEFQPGIFSLDASGSSQGAGVISGTATIAGPAGPQSSPAVRGTDYLSIYCTGLGAVTSSDGTPPPADGSPASLTTLYKTAGAVTVTVGGVNVQAPPGTPVGSALPMMMTVSDPATGFSQSNTVTVVLQ